MEKYLADRLYALIYRMCQVQAFSSRLHARGFPAIGKYEPKTPPRTAGVTKCVIGFDRYSGFVRRFCREGPILRNPETGRTSLPRSRTRGRSALSPAAFPVLSPGGVVRLRTDTIPGEFVSLFLSRFSARCRNCSPPGLSVRPDRKPSVADRKIVAFGCRIGPECRLLSGRSGSRPAPEPPPRRRHPIPLGRRRQSYVSLCGGHTRPGVAISPNRGLRPADRVSDRLPVTRPLPTERSSRAKAKASETRNPVRQGI